jgi:transcription initiation factor TFIIIB Brf1 subunit/transcription initiation factor TFIIB
MEVERAWADFDLIRSSEHGETKIQPFADFLCQSCGGRRQFDVFDDLPVCIDCGRTDAEFMSDEPEWRSGGDDGKPDPSRVGAPVNTDHFSAAWGASTIMNVARAASYQQKRLAMINMHTSMNHRDRALFHAYAHLDMIGKTILSLPDNVMYSAKIKYKAFNEAVLTRGAVRNGIKANCVFQACREFGVARTTAEIAEAFGIPARDLSRTFEIYQEQVPETRVHVTTPADLVPRFFNSITQVPAEARGRLKMKIVKVCKGLEDCVELMGRTPKAIVCAVMFAVLKNAGIQIERSEICRICDVSVPTLVKIENIIKEQK